MRRLILGGLASGFALLSCVQIAGFERARPGWGDVPDGGTTSTTSTSSGTGGTGGSPSCTDKVKDGNETDVDCGGTCPGCMIGQTCVVNTDCASGACQAGKCVDFVTWLKHMGGVSGTDAATLAGLGVDATGNAVVAAGFTGKASFGGSAAYDTGATSARGFAFGRYDALGTHIWDSGYVSGNPLVDETVGLLAVSASGNFVALGAYGSQGLDFGNTVTLPGAAPAPIAVFAVGFNPSNVATWAQHYGGPAGLSSLAVGGVATDALGSAFVAVGAGSFGAYSLTTTNHTTININNGDLFVVDIGANWGLTFNDGGISDAFAGVATNSKGDVIAAGRHEGAINWGGGPKDSAVLGQGFVVKFASPGAYKWDASFAASPDGLAVDANDNVVLCGEFSGSVDFGMGMLMTTAPSAIFVVKYSSAGTAIWNKAFDVAGATSSVKTVVATDASGNVLLAANTPAGTVDFGGGMLSASILVAKLDSSGSHVWSKGFGTGKLDRATGIAPYDDTQILVGGNFAGGLQIGTQTVSSVGATDIFLAKLHVP